MEARRSFCYEVLGRALSCFLCSSCFCFVTCCCLIFSLSFLPPLSPMVAPSRHYDPSRRVHDGEPTRPRRGPWPPTFTLHCETVSDLPAGESAEVRRTSDAGIARKAVERLERNGSTPSTGGSCRLLAAVETAGPKVTGGSRARGHPRPSGDDIRCVRCPPCPGPVVGPRFVATDACQPQLELER